MPSVSSKQRRAPPGQVGLVCSICSGTKEVVWHLKNGVKIPRSMCRPCHSATSYKSRLKRKDEYNKQVAVRRQSEPMFRAYELWHNAKCRASQKGLEFNLPRSFVESALMIGVCQVTGLPFDLKIKDKRMGSMSPSLDRINPQFGYVVGNVQAVCWLYNRAKGDGSHEDVLKLVEALSAVKNTRTA